MVFRRMRRFLQQAISTSQRGIVAFHHHSHSHSSHSDHYSCSLRQGIVLLALSIGCLCTFASTAAADPAQDTFPPSLNPISSFEPNKLSQDSGSFEPWSAHLLLLDLAGVNARFGQYYREFTLSPSGFTATEVARMQADVATYWHYVMAIEGCHHAEAEALSVIPHDSQYQLVLKRLLHLMQLDAVDSWDPLVLEAKLTLGMEHLIIDTIAKRLWLLGYSAERLNTGGVYREELVAAVKWFQQSHGVQQDGVIGKQTLYWLNQSPRVRAVLLAKNTIRQRVLESRLGPSYLLINVPAFEMKLVENGLTVLDSKVIVGKPTRQTPILDSQISSVVLNPSWRVPSSILRRDILPQIRKNGHYIHDRGFDVYDEHGQWIEHTAEEWQVLAATRFPYQLVQRPGVKNALGKYKFHFDNSFSVYLHGTSEPSLFNKEDRALSSGCIRIEKVAELAQWFKTRLVKDRRLWDKLAPNITAPQWFALSETLPVHLVYWTAWVDEKGQDHYRNDRYHLEAELTNAVASTIWSTN